MKLIEKTCQNPDCGHVEDLPEETRFCPVEECGWQMTPYDFHMDKKSKEEEILKLIGQDKLVKILGVELKIGKKKRRVGLICPECGAEYPGWRSKMWAEHEELARRERERQEALKKGVRPK